jgi:hypothetical protein
LNPLTLFRGLKPPAPSEEQEQGKEQIRRFWLRQNDEQEQTTAKEEADSFATLRNDKQKGE